MAKKDASNETEPQTIRDRLLDPAATFSSKEIYQVFETLAEDYGFYRDPKLPEPGQSIETMSMTVKGFEHLGALIVRPRTIRDSMVSLPGLVDKLLGDNMNPSRNATNNANLIAIAQHAIVSPPNLVDKLLQSGNPKDIAFFLNFANEYADWLDQKSKEADQKKSGTTSGSESASTSDTSEISSPQTLDG
jgi:hypothetical protein